MRIQNRPRPLLAIALARSIEELVAHLRRAVFRGTVAGVKLGMRVQVEIYAIVRLTTSKGRQCRASGLTIFGGYAATALDGTTLDTSPGYPATPARDL